MLTLKKVMAVVAILFATLCALSSSAHAQSGPEIWTVHVDINNGALSPPNFGLDGWGANAHRFLQDAIKAAKDLFDLPTAPPDLEVHIWIAAAFDESDPPKPIPYRPDQKASHEDPDHPDSSMQCDPEAPHCCPPYGNCSYIVSFDVSDAAGDIHFVGGFPPDPQNVGENGATIEDRDPVLHKTVLSGDLKQNDEFSWGYDANGILELHYDNYRQWPAGWKNSERIVTNNGTQTLVIDGLTLRGALNIAVSTGIDSTTVIQDCVVEENKQGALFLLGNSMIRRTLVHHNGSKTTDRSGPIHYSYLGMNPREHAIVDSKIK